MMIRKNILSTIAVVVLGLTPIAITVPAYAATTTTTQSNFFQGLVQFIAQKFGLDQNQVSTAVADYRNQHKQQMLQNLQNKDKARLDSLVSQGKITAAQEQQILDEQAKLKSEYNFANFKSLTPQQRKDERTKMQAEIASWSSSTGIDKKYLLPRLGLGWGRGMHFFGGPKLTVTPTP